LAAGRSSAKPSAIQAHNCNKFYHWKPLITMAAVVSTEFGPAATTTPHVHYDSPANRTGPPRGCIVAEQTLARTVAAWE